MCAIYDFKCSIKVTIDTTIQSSPFNVLDSSSSKAIVLLNVSPCDRQILSGYDNGRLNKCHEYQQVYHQQFIIILCNIAWMASFQRCTRNLSWYVSFCNYNASLIGLRRNAYRLEVEFKSFYTNKFHHL